MNKGTLGIVLAILFFWIGVILWGTLSPGYPWETPVRLVHGLRTYLLLHMSSVPESLKGHYRSLKDVSINFTLYVPLGFLVFLFVQGFFKRPVWACGIALLSSLSLSWLIETSQTSIPLRYSNAHDLFWNTLGGLGGAWGALTFLKPAQKPSRRES